MLKYEDGTPASTPQMANDVATFLDYLGAFNFPDFRLSMVMCASTIITWFAISWFYIKYHEFNLHSCKPPIF